MSKVNKLDAYTRVAHRIAVLPDGWQAHEAKPAYAADGTAGANVLGAAFKPLRYTSVARPKWSRKITGTAQTVFISDQARDAALAEMRAEIKAKNSAKFPFMFVIVNDEADAADFLNHTILPDYFARDRMVSGKQVWKLIQQWGGNKVRTARIDRIISAALQTWNERAVELERQQRQADRKAMA